jgi:hypothetical protein
MRAIRLKELWVVTEEVFPRFGGVESAPNPFEVKVLSISPVHAGD